jgi:hypothetical protein
MKHAEYRAAKDITELTIFKREKEMNAWYTIALCKANVQNHKQSPINNYQKKCLRLNKNIT